MLYHFFKHISFAYPWVLAGFISLPLLVWWYVQRSNKNQASLKVSTTHAFTVKTIRERLRHLPFIMRLLTLACIILVLGRPQKRNDQQRTEGEGIDIVLCMDISGSMGSADIPPSRMEVAKAVAEEFVVSRPTDRIGLVVFAGESFTQSPITTDKNTLITQIQNLRNSDLVKPGLLPDGTVIGEGLATAVDRLATTNGKTKVVILITDGKEDAPATRLIDPLTALEIAKAKNVKVYAIGIGAMPSTIKENSGVVKTKSPEIDFIDEGLLQRIAKETGGQFFRAKDKAALQETYRQIDQLEKSKVEIITSKHYQEMYLPIMLAALFFLVAEVVISTMIIRRFP
jgi:Ca-activated chloride channel homolog